MVWSVSEWQGIPNWGLQQISCIRQIHRICCEFLAVSGSGLWFGAADEFSIAFDQTKKSANYLVGAFNLQHDATGVCSVLNLQTQGRLGILSFAGGVIKGIAAGEGFQGVQVLLGIDQKGINQNAVVVAGVAHFLA